MINHPYNATQPTDVGSHQTLEALRPQRSHVQRSFLPVILILICIFALVIGIACFFSAEQSKEFSGELIQDGQSQPCTLVLTHTRKDLRSEFSTISGSIEIFDESGALLFSHSLSGHPEAHNGYLSYLVYVEKKIVLFFDPTLEQLVLTNPDFTFTAASPEFLELTGVSP